MKMATPEEILQKYWGYSQFRSLQLDIINSVLAQKDTLALMPTGGGKSVCFQVPGLILGGLTLVITPLVALMKDQVMQLKKRGIKAASLDAGMHWKEVQIVLDNAAAKAYDFLYISPERLQSESFFERFQALNITLVAIDEAHCISQWGYDFRPSYLKIAKIRTFFPEIPIIAVTATATPEVAKDIVDQLQMANCQVFRKSFARHNLSYSVFEVEDKTQKAIKILGKVVGTAVVYVRTRKKTKLIADALLKAGISSTYFHAGLSYEERNLKQKQWLNSKVRVIVATNAFGMGIDKSDVRVVIHVDIPDSIEAYYQEAGRAGRDEKKAYGVALYSKLDLMELISKVEEQYPSIEFIKKVYQSLANYFQIATGLSNQSLDFDLVDFQKKFSLDSKSTFFALKHLEQQGLVVFNESYFQPSALFVPDHEVLYQFQVANAKYDAFVRVILRTYGGEIYTDFISISEKVLAEKLNVDIAIVITFLQALDKAAIWIYRQQKDAPQISFLNERFALNALPFDTKIYTFRKERSLDKIKQIQNLLTSKEACRTNIIQKYFGEEPEDRCGVCDNCLNLNKLKNHEINLNSTLGEIRQILEANEMLPDEVVRKITPKYVAFFKEAIQILLETGELKYSALGMLKLKH